MSSYSPNILKRDRNRRKKFLQGSGIARVPNSDITMRSLSLLLLKALLCRNRLMYVTSPLSILNWCIIAIPSNQWLKLQSNTDVNSGSCFFSLSFCTAAYLSVFFSYCVFPNSNFPGPLRRSLPLIQGGMFPCTSVEISSGVSSTVRTRGAMDSSPFSTVVMHSVALTFSTGLASSIAKTCTVSYLLGDWEVCVFKQKEMRYASVSKFPY